MTGRLDRQDVLRVLDEHMVGVGHQVAVTGYRERLAAALMALSETPAAFIAVACTDMEDYARIHNEGYSEAVRQFTDLLTDARSDLEPGAPAGDLLSWLDDLVKAMRGPEVEPGASLREQLTRTMHARELLHEWGDKAYGCDNCREVYLRRADAVVPVLGAGDR